MVPNDQCREQGGSCDEMCGTAPYMSPELWEKKPYTTEPDVWALGVTMAILLTGDLPFDGKAPEDLSHIVRTQELNLDAQPWWCQPRAALNCLAVLHTPQPLTDWQR